MPVETDHRLGSTKDRRTRLDPAACCSTSHGSTAVEAVHFAVEIKYGWRNGYDVAAAGRAAFSCGAPG